MVNCTPIVNSWVCSKGFFRDALCLRYGWIPSCLPTVFVASMISIRNNQPYSHVLNWLRCHLGFSLIRSAIMCLHGAKSSYHHPIKPDCAAIDLALSESKVHN